MPLRLFKFKSDVAALLVGFLHKVVCPVTHHYEYKYGLTSWQYVKSYFALSYYLPLYGQAVIGYSPLQSGIFVLPFEISLSISSFMSGTIMKITGKPSHSNFEGWYLTVISKGRYLELLYLGLSLLIVSMRLLIHFTTIATPTFVFTIIQTLAGAATGIMYPPPLIALQTAIQARDNATATSTFSFIR